MSKLWPKVSKERPCPICERSDWLCRFGDKAIVCMRVESQKPARDGGWYHFYDDKNPKPPIIPKRIQMPKVNLDFESNHSCLGRADWGLLPSLLGVSDASIAALDARRYSNEKAWGVPMRDGDNKIIGIHLRCDDGSKKAIVGSRNGLFLAQGIEPQKIAFICEGASNTAALLTMGFYAIGRPSCNSGSDMLKVALNRLGVHRIVIVADNDGIKIRPDNKTFRPGQDGASKLKKELGLMSVIFTTPNPIKDVRGLLNKVGVESAKHIIEDSIAGKVWTRV